MPIVKRVAVAFLILLALWLPALIMLWPIYNPPLVLPQSPYWAYVVLSLPLLYLAALEWAKLAGLQTTKLRVSYAGFISILFLGLGYFLSTAIPLFNFILMGISTLGWFIVALYFVTKRKEAHPIFSQWTMSMLGLFVLLPAWLLLYQYDYDGFRQGFGIILLSLIWGVDICAYVAKRAWGDITWGSFLEGMSIVAILLCMLTSAYFEIWQGFLFFVAPILIIMIFLIIGRRFKNLLMSEQTKTDDLYILDTIASITAALPVALFLYGILLMTTDTEGIGFHSLFIKCPPGIQC